MAVVTAFLVGVLIGLALRPLVNAYVLSKVVRRFERDESLVDDGGHALHDGTVR